MNMDPAPMATMLEKMYKISVYQMANVPPYLMTHPEPKRRLGYIQDMLLSAPPHKYPPRDDFAFLRIKCRIMAMTKDPANLRSIYLRQAEQAKEPQKTMANYGLYLSYLNGAEYDKAKETLQKVIKHFKDKAILQTDLGMIAFREGKYSQALQDFQQALNANPDDAFSAYNKADTLEHLGREKEAMQVYQNLISVIPDFTKLRFQLGKLLSDSGRTGAGHYQLGEYFWLNGDHKTAKYHLNRALHDQTSDKETLQLAQEQLKKIKGVEKEQ